MTGVASFDALRARALGRTGTARCAVPGAADDHAVEAVFLAQRLGYATPVLIGQEDAIRPVVERLGFADDRHVIVECPAERNPSEVAVELVRQGEADFILKGNITTKELLGPILNKATGLNDNGFITHFGLMQITGYHKLLAMSDSAVIPYPTLEDKRRIVEICTQTLRRLGVTTPVVAALCSVEVVNPKMVETVEAAALAEMSERGELGDAVVVGPISFDLATCAHSAAIKGYISPYAGDVDMLLVPQMVTGNVMSKIWNVDPANILAGCLVGARVPIALTSRSASMNEKLHSLLLCSLLSGPPIERPSLAGTGPSTTQNHAE